MPTYKQSNVTKIYQGSTTSSALDRVVFTIDHVHHGGPGLYDTLDVVAFLVGKKIPITIFIQCSDPLNRCPKERASAKQLFDLDPHLVSLAPHSLSPKNSPLAQRNNLSLIQDVIKDTTNAHSSVMSYHGHRAGPENGISYAGIDYARGIKTSSRTQSDNPFDTPVMGLNSVSSAFNYTSSRNSKGFCATLFVHSSELRNGTPKKRVFDTFVKEVDASRLQAVDYHSAMRSDFSASPSVPTPPTTPTVPSSNCPPLVHLSSNRLSQDLQKGDRDGQYGIAQVAEFQRFLNELGLNAGIVDGIFGNNTKLAVIGYQILMGLVPNGIADISTRSSVNAFCG